MPTIAHDPQAKLDHTWRWLNWLNETATGDTIVSATITPDAGLIVTNVVVASPLVTVWITGGTLGTTYAAKCHIVTAQGREDDYTLSFAVMDR